MAESQVTLRPHTLADLERLYEFQLDQQSNALAGTKPRTFEAFRAAWEERDRNGALVGRVIVVDGEIAGGIGSFEREGVLQVGYWIGRPYWGRGVASRALALLLVEVTARPLVAHAAAWNGASIRVLEKNGFRETGRFVDKESERYVAGEVVKFVLE